MTDRAKLEEALEMYRGAETTRPLLLIIAAAEAHLATLPKPAEPEDHVIICRNKATGTLTFWRGLGKEVMTAAEAAERVKQWTRQYHDTAYVAVKVPA